MGNDGLLILGAAEVAASLENRESDLVEIVEKAYLAHRDGMSSLPHSTFLRFPGDDLNRIIALPAFLGNEFDVAGVKWIASFPANVQRGLERASAVVVLNSCTTGRPETILEGSIISARRTAASAALGARELLDGRSVERVGLVGTGVINFEVVRFLNTVLPGLRRFQLFDLEGERAARFGEGLRKLLGEVEVEIAGSLEDVLAGSPLVSFATTAVRPYVSDLSACVPGAVLLHVSLRDLAPEVLLACDNVVDDADHVCRAQTSVHLAEQRTGGRDFIRCSLGDILAEAAPRRRGDGSISVFNPFGLGILDLAVARRVADWAGAAGRGTCIPSFLPNGE